MNRLLNNTGRYSQYHSYQVGGETSDGMGIERVIVAPSAQEVVNVWGRMFPDATLSFFAENLKQVVIVPPVPLDEDIAKGGDIRAYIVGGEADYGTVAETLVIAHSPQEALDGWRLVYPHAAATHMSVDYRDIIVLSEDGIIRDTDMAEEMRTEGMGCGTLDLLQ